MTDKLQIKRSTTIEAFQKAFNSIYPFLKVEFFTEPHTTGKGSAKNKLVPAYSTLGEIQKIKKQGSVLVESLSSVSSFEKLFREKFGLNIQVFRKSGNIWLETTSTDDWSLEQQNEEGESLAQHLKTEKEDPDDHDIY